MIAILVKTHSPKNNVNTKFIFTGMYFPSCTIFSGCKQLKYLNYLMMCRNEFDDFILMIWFTLRW